MLSVFRRIYGPDYPSLVFCNLRNISACTISEDNQNFVISIQNPLPYKKSVPVKFPLLKDSYYKVFSANGKH